MLWEPSSPCVDVGIFAGWVVPQRGLYFPPRYRWHNIRGSVGGGEPNFNASPALAGFC